MTDEVDRVRMVVDATSPGVAAVRAALDVAGSFLGRAVEVDVSAVQAMGSDAGDALLRGVLGVGDARALVVRGASAEVESVLRASAELLGLSPRLMVL